MKLIKEIGQWILVALGLAALPFFVCIATEGACYGELQPLCAAISVCDSK